MAKELAELLVARRKDDARYRLTCEITNLHAVQGRNDGLTKLKHQAVSEVSDTKHTEGTVQGDETMPQTRRRGRQKNVEREVQTYRFERNGKPDTVMLEIGGPYGLFAKALRDAVVAKDKAKYWLPGLTLISFHPVDGLTERYIEITKAKVTLDALDGHSGDPMPRMEPRNGRGGARTMVPVFHERMPEAIKVILDMVVNAECPRSPEEITGLLHAMQAVPFGPAKRGKLFIKKVERLKA